MYHIGPAASVGAGASLMAVTHVAPLWLALSAIALIALAGAILRIIPKSQA